MTLILATRNQHKAAELKAMLGVGESCFTLTDFPGAPAVEEDEPTFAGNATKKALALAHWLAGAGAHSGGLLKPDWAAQDIYVLADDSGLEVDALQGRPGVHSARFAALDRPEHRGNSSDAANNAKLLRLLSGVPPEKRTARFRCVIALAPLLPPETGNASPVCHGDAIEMCVELFEGTCEGRIDEAPRGAGGFGYDPLFVPDGYDRSFAELGDVEKNQISHRARAMVKLRQRWSRSV